MATEVRESNNGFLYFIVGALIVGVVVLAFLYFNGNLDGGAQQAATDASVERSADAIGDAADSIGDAAEDVSRNPG